MKNKYSPGDTVCVPVTIDSAVLFRNNSMCYSVSIPGEPDIELPEDEK